MPGKRKSTPAARRRSAFKRGRRSGYSRYRPSRAPVRYGYKSAQSSASMTNKGARVITIKDRHFIGDVLKKGDIPAGKIQVDEFRLNPADATAFPWLSDIALHFESYVFKKLKFELKPNLPTSTAGNMLAVMDYDAADDPPSDRDWET